MSKLIIIRLYTIGGLEWMTGPMDWTTGLSSSSLPKNKKAFSVVYELYIIILNKNDAS